MTRQSFPTLAGASLAAACALVSAAALGQTLTGASAWSDRERLFAHFERATEGHLKALYLRCARDSSERLLSFDEAARCSIAGEALKARSFGGDFNALLAWWLQHRDDPLDEPTDERTPVVEAARRNP